MAERREIPEYPGYSVTDDGKVWTRLRRGQGKFTVGETWKQMKPTAHASGHLCVFLYGVGSERPTVKKYVHVLVLEAFVGPCPEGKEGCHSPDCDPTNNRIENLRWDTHDENMKDSMRHGNSTRGEKGWNAKVTAEIARDIRTQRENGVRGIDLAIKYGINPATVGDIYKKRTWRHI